MANRAVPTTFRLHLALKASIVSFCLTGTACAESLVPDVKVVGESRDRDLFVSGQIFDLSAMSIDLHGQWGDYMLVITQSGGTGCPTSHYWLDLGKAPPVLSDPFGDCYEVVEITEADDGSLMAKAAGVENPNVFTYRGGTKIETHREYTFTTDAAQSAPALDFSESYIGDLFADAHWGPKLMTMLGEERFNAVRGYHSGPSNTTFAREGDWWVATGCGRGACNKVGMVAAVDPETDEVLLAMYSPYAEDKLQLIGVPSSKIPYSLSRFLGETAEYAALKRAFNQLGSAARRDIQIWMKEKEFYSSSIDGLFGQGTAAGLVMLAVSTAHDYGVLPDMVSPEGARALVQRLSHRVFPALNAAPGSFPFEGDWDCDGSAVTLTSESYKFGQQPTLMISEVVDISETARGVMFTDGYRIAFFDITNSSMQWHSPASGDTFDCKKTTEAAPETPAPQEQQIAQDALPAPEEPREQDSALRYPFQGEWTCADNATEEVLTDLLLTEIDVNIAFMGTRISYEEVSPIGRNGTAFNVVLRDGQMGGIYELSGDHFLLNISGLSLSCER